MTNTLERYSKKYQGFLVYHSDKKMNAVLLDSYFETKYRIKFDNDDISFDTRNISKELANFLEYDGGIVEKIQVKRTRGKKKLFELPVQIKKIKDEDNLDAIEIKIIGNNYDNISKKIESIKQNLSEYGFKPKECIRERKDLEEDIDEEDLEDEEEFDKEENQEDQILDVHHFSERHIKEI